jgi:hypothetical protein
MNVARARVIHIRRENLGVVPRSRVVLCCPVPTPIHQTNHCTQPHIKPFAFIGKQRSCATALPQYCTTPHCMQVDAVRNSLGLGGSQRVHLLGHGKSLLDDANSSLGDATSSLGDATSSLGDATSSLGDAKSSRWVTLRARWVTLRARWVTLRARWVTLRARWVTLRARWVTLRARWVTLRAR